ncbi:hypothetical protein V6N11_014724 [Hibiscus sabdariffa]|uniref:Uncharacterized protein n=1 Tax=Hibiscus sabdariffa TaxID=183260 RepID=A0ABR2TPX0_9ROSI
MAVEGREVESGPMRKTNRSIRSIFVHADGVDKCLMAAGLIGAAADGTMTPVIFYLTGRMFNNIGDSDWASAGDVLSRNVRQVALLFIFAACGGLVGCFLEGVCWTITSERQATRMRSRYLKAVLRQDVGYFDLNATSTAEIVTSISNDSLIIQEVISEKIPYLIARGTTFIESYIVGFLLLWRLALVVLPFVLLLVIPSLIYGKILLSLARQSRVEYNLASTIAEQAISSVRTVYAFVGENKTSIKFSEALQGSVKLGLKQGLAKGLAIGSNGITYFVWAFIAFYGARMVKSHGAKGGSIFAVAFCIAHGGQQLGSCLSTLKPVYEACSAAERINEVIKRVPKIDLESMEGEILDNVRGEVEFKQVEFAYPSRPENIVFKDFSLRIPAGKTVALVGSSGSGKSTVISLLQRFYDPLGGDIVLDGVPVNKLQLKWLRSQMGLVSQEPTLFATTIKENILFGKEDAPMEEIIKVAKASNAHNFISQFPQGYDTQVGERGIQLSGGQKQRIAIARAIIKAPKILLLDEATSALDSESERIVQEALDNASIRRTTIIVAHRLSTIRHADLIVVLQDGQVMETGSHDELMVNVKGFYSMLVQLQHTEQKHVWEKDDKDSCTDALASTTENDINNASSHRLSLVKQTNSAKSFAPKQSSPGEEMNVKDKKLPAPSFRRLLAMNLPEWKEATLGCLGAVLYGAVQPVSFFTIGSTTSMFFFTDHGEIREKAKVYATVFVGLGCFSLINNVILHYNFAYMGEHLTKRIRERLLSKILTFEVGWFDQDENSSGTVCSRLANDASVVRSLVGDRMSLLVQSISGVTVACIMGLFIAWRLAVVMIAVQPLAILSMYTIRVLLKTVSKNAIKAQKDSSKLAADAVSNHRTITAFSSQDRILKMLEKAFEGMRKENACRSWFTGLGIGSAQLLILCISAFLFWYGGKLISQGYISSKTFIETYLVLSATGSIIAEAASMTSDSIKSSQVVASLFAILDHRTRIEPDDSNGYLAEEVTGCVEIHDVDFAYPARPNVVILKDFSFTIEAGRSTALIGQSGSGKSTIISLIERFYDPLKGAVKIDGRDIRSYNLRALRKHIALVSQEPTLFAGTIRENILYGVSNETNESEVIEAAKAANAHEFIAGLAKGYETWCGDKGVQLSGGQKQRIAIARAVLKNPTILLLDEATSALDSKSEKSVQEALDRIMVGRTSVVVAHRLSTIKNCDLIAVIKQGKVVETDLERMGLPITAEFNGKNQVPREGSAAGGAGGTGGGGAGETSASQESIKAKLEIYLKEVKELFHDREDKYDMFHQVVKDFMDQRTDVVSVIAQVKELLKGHNNFIHEFNAFLPNGYEIIPDDDTPPPEKPEAFVSALSFVNKLKLRFQNEEHVYKSFLDIMSGCRKKKYTMDEVASVFKDHPDLFEEFETFLPNT